MTPRLELRGITKTFPGVLANDDVSLTVMPGEIHAVLGENGAGKSTLMKIIYGALAADEGEILWNGEPVRIPSPTAARHLGIGMVYQHFSLFETCPSPRTSPSRWTSPSTFPRSRRACASSPSATGCRSTPTGCSTTSRSASGSGSRSCAASSSARPSSSSTSRPRCSPPRRRGACSRPCGSSREKGAACSTSATSSRRSAISATPRRSSGRGPSPAPPTRGPPRPRSSPR